MNINGHEINPHANLEGANLEGANLRYANLRCANLRGADLEGADLEGADLRFANLVSANLRCANLQRADLRSANLEGAALRSANLVGANLRSANLVGANLEGADLQGANLPDFQIVPTEGSFIAYKKVSFGVIKIEIPADAKRTSTLVGRKCRASHVKVLEGSGFSCTYTENPIKYETGSTVYADSFNDDIRVECTNGIHFFMTEKEADEWGT